MSIVNEQGFGKGPITINSRGVGDNNIPLLSSFYFRFERPGSSGAVDNHINQIHVLPGGVSEDLSPNADLSPSNEAVGTVALMYADKDYNDTARDNYFYNVSYATLPTTQARRFQFRDVGCTGTCRQTLPPPPRPGHPGLGSRVFVLCGFKLFFTGARDRHVDKISILEDNGTLTIQFRDKSASNSDVYGYLVDYAWVDTFLSPSGETFSMGEESGTAKGGESISLAGNKLIRGFDFDFANKDHHLREIGVRSVNDNLEVYYADKDANDVFNWRVRWATITPLVIGQ